MAFNTGRCFCWEKVISPAVVACAPTGWKMGFTNLGFHFRPMHWGKGFAGEASRAVIGHAFKSLGARGLFAGHYPENHASSKVLEKLGFRFTHEEPYPPTGRMHRCYMLELPA